MRILDWLTGKLYGKGVPPGDRSEPMDRNLPLQYVRDKTGLDISVYRKIAQMVNDHAHAAAEQFAGRLGAEPNNQLVHYFHDMFTAVAILPQMRRLSVDNDVASAVVDGVHFEFYADAAPKIVLSILQLLAEKPTCFFQTFVKGLGKTDTTMRYVQFAAYCIDADRLLGATEALELSQAFMRVLKEKTTSISTATHIMLRK